MRGLCKDMLAEKEGIDGIFYSLDSWDPLFRCIPPRCFVINGTSEGAVWAEGQRHRGRIQPIVQLGDMNGGRKLRTVEHS